MRVHWVKHEKSTSKIKEEMMMKFLPTNFFIVILVVAFSIVGGTTKAGQIKLDFEKANQLKEWEVISGDWKIENGVITGQFAKPAPGSDNGVGIVYGEPDWTDYTLEVKIRSDAGGTNAPGPIARFTDISNYYFFECYADQMIFRPHTDGTDRGWAEGGAVPGFPGIGKWHDLKIELEGNHVKVSVNGAEVLDFDSTFPVEKGKIGLTTWGLAGEITSYDDLVITGDQIKGLPVNPKGKLTSVWGEIKRMQ